MREGRYRWSLSAGCTSRQRLELCLDCREAGLEGLDLRLLRLDGRALLLELVEEHRRHLVVRDALDLTAGVAGHQFRHHLLDLLGEKAVLQRAVGLRLEAEGHRPQLHQPAGGFAHVLHVLLDADRGGRRAKLASGVDEHRDGVAQPVGDASDPSDARLVLICTGVDADCFSLRGYAWVLNMDVVVSCKVVYAGADAGAGVAAW